MTKRVDTSHPEFGQGARWISVQVKAEIEKTDLESHESLQADLADRISAILWDTDNWP